MNKEKLYVYKLEKVEVNLGENIPMKFFAISKAMATSHLLVLLNEKLKA